jgi:hypothetical protein
MSERWRRGNISHGYSKGSRRETSDARYIGTVTVKAYKMGEPA